MGKILQNRYVVLVTGLGHILQNVFGTLQVRADELREIFLYGLSFRNRQVPEIIKYYFTPLRTVVEIPKIIG